MQAIRRYITQRVARWTKSRQKTGNPQQLTTKNTYILPTWFGVIYGVVLVTLLITAINYQLSPAFLFIFLLMVIGLSSAWESHRNVCGTSIRLLGIEDSTAGIPARLNLFISNHQAKKQIALMLLIDNQPLRKINTILERGEKITVPIKTHHRGCFSLSRITLCSYFPFGLFRVWGYVSFNKKYYVYPKPLSPGYWPNPNQSKQDACKTQTLIGDDELYELKPIGSPWNQPERIAWKLSAKGQGWLLQSLTSPKSERLHFCLEALPGNNLERKLQQLSYWLQTAEHQGHAYSLQLGAQCTDTHQGKKHLQYCLRKLATYE